MPIDASSFVFIISLAAVINGLGIVRWLTGFAEFVRRRSQIDVRPSWVYSSMAVFQFLLHVLFWWSLWNIRGTASVNFLSYLYLLAGPILLFIGTVLLSVGPDTDSVDLESHYESVRKPYATVLGLAWLWAVLLSPVLRGTIADNAPVFLAFLAIAVIQRLLGNPLAQRIVAAANWVVIIWFVVFFQLYLGGTAAAPP